MSKLSPGAQKAMERLRRDYASSLPRRLMALDAAWNIVQEVATEEAIAELRKVAHSLAGGAGTFGYPGIGQRARALEERIDILTAAEAGQIAVLAGLLDRLRLELRLAIEEFRSS